MEKNSLRLSLQKARIDSLQSSTKPQQMPSVGSMAKNVVQSVVQNVQSVAAGNTLRITDQEANDRLNICKTCDFPSFYLGHQRIGRRVCNPSPIKKRLPK